MNRGLFITGTGTGVGKTFVTALLAKWLCARLDGISVMKPVESGCVADPAIGCGLAPSDALTLMKAAGVTDPLDTVNPYRFKEPLSPNVAARIEGVAISMETIMERFGKLTEGGRPVLVEGAGGFLTPVSDEERVADMAARMGLPVLIVAASGLGCINSTLLTVEAVCARGLTVAGTVLNNPVPEDGNDSSYRYNLQEIARYAEARVLGELAFTAPGGARPLEESIDTARLFALCTDGLQ